MIYRNCFTVDCVNMIDALKPKLCGVGQKRTKYPDYDPDHSQMK